MGSIGNTVNTANITRESENPDRANPILANNDYTELMDYLTAGQLRSMREYSDDDDYIYTMETKAADKFVSTMVKEWEQTIGDQLEVEIPGLGFGVIRNETNSSRDPLANFPGRGNTKYYEWEAADWEGTTFESGFAEKLSDAKRDAQNALLRRYRG